MKINWVRVWFKNGGEVEEDLWESGSDTTVALSITDFGLFITDSNEVPLAIYAPGRWVKVEIGRSDDPERDSDD